MLSPIRIAVDVMGGDLGSRLAVLAALQFAKSCPEVQLTLFGAESEISPHVPAGDSRLRVVHTPEFVAMGDKPSHALRHKAGSSMSLAVQSVQRAEADACVSAGNTGALMAFGLQRLGTLPGIDRPAICKGIPTEKGRSFLLDLGANIQCEARHLAQFGLMGAAMARAAGLSDPRVALLNIGLEPQKGGSLQQDAMALLQTLPVNISGYVEGNGIYRGDADVIVCDGFTGNAVLKASEGAAHFMSKSMRNAFQKNLLSRLQGCLVGGLLREWAAQFDPQAYNGAALLGLNGIVIKSHGASTAPGFMAALQVAYEQTRCELLSSVRQALTHPAG